MKSIAVHRMTASDLPGANELRRLAGWNQRPEDWGRFLAWEPHGCFVAKQSDQVAGTVTTTIYSRALAWLGMMLVHPDHRRQGIGRLLMNHALEYLKVRGVASVKLDATPAGLPLYTQLGFVPEWTLTRWHAAPESLVPLMAAAPRQSRTITPADWPAIETLDVAVLGVPRGRLLRTLAQDSRANLAWPAHSQIAGWGLLRPGANAQYLGPLVCPSAEGALLLVSDLLAACAGAPVFWDIPDENEPARQLAQYFGFQPVRPLTRLRLGPDTGLGRPQAQLGIADPALG